MGKNEEEPTLEQLLKTFTPTQLDFVAARIADARSDKEAADLLGISVDVVYNWPNKQVINAAVKLAKMNGVSVAREKLQRLATKAVDKLGDAIDKADPALSALFGVLDRVGLPEVKRVEATGAEGGPIQLIGIDPDGKQEGSD